MKFPEMKTPPPSGKEQKISLNLSQFKTPPPAPKPVPKPTPVVPPIPKPIVKEPLKPTPVKKKKIVNNKKRVYVENLEENNVTKAEPKKKIVKKEIKKVEKKKVVKKKVIKRKPVKRRAPQKRSNSALANSLLKSASSMYPSQSATPASSGSYSANMINKLYGSEFNSYSPTQKNFIRKNLGLIHRITQRTLTRNGYPEVAVRTGQQGTNVVSFYLHPNGDISNLRLKTKIGYTALDENTLEVIRIAYKDYPLPNKKTKIIFYVQYSIY